MMNKHTLISYNNHSLNPLNNLLIRHNSPKCCPPLALKETVYFNFKNSGIPLDSHFYNPYQETTTGLHINNSKRQTMIYQNVVSHQTLMKSQTHQSKVIRNYQEPFKLTLSKIQQFIRQHHQNKISNLSLT